MTTEQRLSTPPPHRPADGPAPKKTDLSLTQVLGGALAAMTAAYLGSRLSVAGTVLGAAVASVVAAVAGSLYTASLRRTRERVRTVWQGRVGDSTVPASVEATGSRDPGWSTEAPAQPSAPVVGRPAPRSRPQWQTVAWSALAAFLLAAVALTGLELATGQSLSGGEGTTVSQVTEPRPAAPQETASPSASPSSRPSPSATASETPDVAPAPSASSSASSSATPAPEPSEAVPSEPAGTPTAEAAPSSPTGTPAG